MKNLPMKWLAVLAAALLVVACGKQQAPAEKAVADIEMSLSSIRDDAGKYASSQLQAVEAGLASLRDSLAKKDYKAVLAAAPALSSQVAELQQTVTAKRDEMQATMAAATDQWRTLSAEVPQMVGAIQSRVDILSQSKKLPKNLKAESFEAAKSGLEWMKTTWAEATSKFGAGDPIDAAAKGEAVKQKGMEVMQLLGMG
jgi:hypothetical protein